MSLESLYFSVMLIETVALNTRFLSSDTFIFVCMPINITFYLYGPVMLGLIPILGPILYTCLTYHMVYKPLLSIKIGRISQVKLQQTMQVYLFLDLMVKKVIHFFSTS